MSTALRDLSVQEIDAEWRSRCARYLKGRRKLRLIALLWLVVGAAAYIVVPRFGISANVVLVFILFAFVAMCLPVLKYAGNRNFDTLKCPKCEQYPLSPYMGSGFDVLGLAACDKCFTPLPPITPASAAGPVRGRGFYFAASASCFVVGVVGLAALMEHVRRPVKGAEWLENIFPFGLALDPVRLLVLTLLALLLSWLLMKVANRR